MTMRFTLTLAREAGDGSSAAMTRSVAIERDMLAPETLGFTLAEAKAILAELQAAIVADQVAAHEREERCCGSCGAARRVKGHRPLTCRTVFGTVQVEALRLRRCGCGKDSVAGDRASFSPVADLLPERTTPELLYLETRWGSLVSYGLAARMLGDVLPLGKAVAPERVRRHLHAVAVREEAMLGDEADGAMWSGCQRDLDELPRPDGPAYVGVDGGFVRDRAGSWFEVIAGKFIPGFCRNAPEDEEPRPARCFAFVQAHDDGAQDPKRTRRSRPSCLACPTSRTCSSWRVRPCRPCCAGRYGSRRTRRRRCRRAQGRSQAAQAPRVADRVVRPAAGEYGARLACDGERRRALS
jgi:hypothetical protein